MLDNLIDDKTKSLEKEDLNELVTKLENELNETRHEINNLLEIKYNYNGDFKPLVSKSEKYEKQISHLYEQINLVKNEIKEKQIIIESSHDIDEYKHVIERIETFNNAIKLLEVLQQFENYLIEFINSIDNKCYSKCYEYLIKIEKLIEINFKTVKQEIDENKERKISSGDGEEHQDENNENKIFIIKYLKDEFFIQKERFYYNFEQLWDNELVKIINDSENMVKFYINKPLLETTINNLKEFFADNLKSPHIMSILRKKFINLNKNLLGLFNQLVKSNKLVKINENFKENVLEINIENDEDKSNNNNSSNEGGNDDDLVQIEFKLNSIEHIITYLNSNLFNLNTTLDLNQTFKKEFKQCFLEAFFKFIYKNLILKSINLDQYNANKMLKLCDLIKNFESFLSQSSIKFIDTSTNNTSNEYETLLFKLFKLNIDNIYINKKCKFYLNEARCLLKEKTKFFESIIVDNVDAVKHIQVLNLNYECENSKNNQFLLFNDCKISQLTKNFIHLIYTILNEAVKFDKIDSSSSSRTSDYNVKITQNISLLCLTAKNVIDLYIYIMPVYYKDEYQNLPLMGAIGFNDFQYLSYHCLTLTHQYKQLLNKLSDESLKTFVDLVPKLCKISYKLLNEHINAQELLLDDYLKTNNNGLANISELNNYSLFEKCIHRCQIQLYNLANVWFNILNKNLYLNLFGKFFNMICKHLIDEILKLDDISADDASYLTKLLNLIRISVNKIFQHVEKHYDENKSVTPPQVNSPQKLLDLSNASSVDDNDDDVSNLNESGSEFKTINLNKTDLDASKYINLWFKYKYLCFILNAHLVDIVNLWSHSKGPLALYFTKDEIRHLITALFMITEKRTAALAEIN